MFAPLDISSLADENLYVPPGFLVTDEKAYKALRSIKSNKSPGPDQVPSRVWKEFAFELAPIVSDLYNSSLREGRVPEILKTSLVIPTPKVTPPKTVEDDLRPITLTSPLAKILEGFTLEHLMNQVAENLDIKQFSMPGRSTTHALVYMLHIILAALDKGVMYGPLYYRCLESDKSKALKSNRGNFDAYMTLSRSSTAELEWWEKNNVLDNKNVISHGAPSHTLTTDASNLGWGAVFENDSTGGTWSVKDQKHHINNLELLAVFLGLKTYCKDLRDAHVRAMIDNTTAIAVLNYMGTSHSPELNLLGKTIWEWCITRGIWLSSAHIPGIANCLADRESRTKIRQTEWMLNTDLVSFALSELEFSPSIDLFASRLNKQFTRYVSFKPDPGALAVDTFTLTLSSLNAESPTGPRNGNLCRPRLADTGLVPESQDHVSQATDHPRPTEEHAVIAGSPSRDTPAAQVPSPAGLPLIRQTLEGNDLGKETIDIIMASWRTGTCKQYNVYLQRWLAFCKDNAISLERATVQDGLTFLTRLYHEGLGYSAINTARSALSTVITTSNGTFGEHPLVTRFLKVKLDTQYVQIMDKKIVFTIRETLKTSRPGKHIQPIELHAYEADNRLCPVTLINSYVQRTQTLRGQHTALLISHAKPHNPVTNATVARWVKSTLQDSGIDTNVFSAHSSRTAAASCSASAGLPLQDILKAGAWSTELTFARFYNKPVEPLNIGNELLQQFNMNN
ncbi:uncharacterized protein LOC116617948 [Nematostella vectensis]|uniref:uncharacterized protein LOC116617948 n=1 Tax=Nematostella vectensis TaxID=45351 RepID=UPI00207707C8|nr:uncharacterized protein LOC116617948 [Nematostella vectensis]